jgi:exonuclease 3'-5' domain-containing protein 1
LYIYQVAFDTEGVNLSRTGQMTVISLSLCQPSSVAFIFDLISIGRSIFSGINSLKDLLESRIIKKITFDCRNDSNALYHQYGISLTNCLDLQVFQLGIKIENRSYSTFSADDPTYLRGLRYVAGEYLTIDEINFFSGIIPHKEDPEIWGTRPLLNIQWQYAANVVHLINRLLRGMRNLKLPLLLQERINIGSKRYTEVFRLADIDYQSDFEKYRHIIMSVEPI